MADDPTTTGKNENRPLQQPELQGGDTIDAEVGDDVTNAAVGKDIQQVDAEGVAAPIIQARGDVTIREGDIYEQRVVILHNTIHNYTTPGSEYRPPLDLPEPIKYFQNRTEQLTKLMADLKPGNVASLIGPGGMGKTALASEAIWRLAAQGELPKRFPDGVLFHTFYHQPLAEQAFHYIATRLGIKEESNPALAARSALSGKRALLILDGTEEAQAGALDALLGIRGSCGVLVTSRLRQDGGPDRQELTPLPLDEAVLLLQAWGGPRAADIHAAQRICELVGELPLALRLAGSYLDQDQIDADEYLTLLLENTRLAALTRGERQAESVPRLLDHSVDRLSPPARELLSVVGLLAFPSTVFSLPPPWRYQRLRR